jgi:hypothetical protein
MTQDTTTPKKNDAFETQFRAFWDDTPPTLQQLAGKGAYETAVAEATKNLLLSKKSQQHVTTTVFATLVGIAPYTELEHLILADEGITERDAQRIATHIHANLYAPHEKDLMGLPVNKTATPPQKTTQQTRTITPAQPAPKTTLQTYIEKHPHLQTRFDKLAPSVQDMLISGPIDHTLEDIVRTYGSTEALKQDLRTHVTEVLVGTETVQTFKDWLHQHKDTLPTQNIIMVAEEKLFGPIRKSILHSIGKQ